MHILEVWHVRTDDDAIRELRLSYEFKEGKAPTFPDHYELVARVTSPEADPDSAFTLTNHIDHLWFDNEGVEVIKKSRSTSVCDVVVVKGVAHRCARIGWETLSNGLKDPHRKCADYYCEDPGYVCTDECIDRCRDAKAWRDRCAADECQQCGGYHDEYIIKHEGLSCDCPPATTSFDSPNS